MQCDPKQFASIHSSSLFLLLSVMPVRLGSLSVKNNNYYNNCKIFKHTTKWMTIKQSSTLNANVRLVAMGFARAHATMVGPGLLFEQHGTVLWSHATQHIAHTW